MRSETFYNHVKKRSFSGDYEFHEEIRQYIRQKQAERDTASIYSDLVEDGEYFDKQILVEIFELYLKDTIGEWDLEYLLNWIEMSGYEFLEGIHEKVIFIFSTPEINYPINKTNITEALRFLNAEILQPFYSGKYDKKIYKSNIVT